MRANGEDGVEKAALDSASLPRTVAFLAPVSIDERKDPLGPHPCRTGKQSSEKGFLAMADAEYLARNPGLVSTQHGGAKARRHTASLRTTCIEPTLWSAMVKDFGRGTWGHDTFMCGLVSFANKNQPLSQPGWLAKKIKNESVA